jgi:hypothetical protein
MLARLLAIVLSAVLSLSRPVRGMEKEGMAGFSGVLG